jgi:hypothetical protein
MATRPARALSTWRCILPVVTTGSDLRTAKTGRRKTRTKALR